MRAITWLVGLSVLLVGCSTKHTTGAGDPSLGVVSITGPSDTTIVPSAGRLSVAEAALLIGNPFIGPTSPVLVMPSNANGVVTVNFTSNSSTGVAAQLGLTVGAYNFNFTTSNISGSLGVGNTVTIIYDGLHFGENGSCTTWVASNVVFTQGPVGGWDTLVGDYAATCHNSQNAKDGDRGTFSLKRPGTLLPPPVDVCPNIEGVQTTVPAGKQLVNGLCVDIVVPPTTVAWCHVSDDNGGARSEHQLNLSQEGIDHGHVGKDGLSTDAGYPHLNWLDQYDYPGSCNGKGAFTPPSNGGGNGNGNGGGNGNGHQ